MSQRSRLLPALLLALATTALAQTPSETPAATPVSHDATARHSFADVDYWRSVFEDPARDEWQHPAAVVAALGLRPSMRVADLGAGTGYFTAYLSRAVGEGGTVFAVELEPNLVVHLRDRAEKDGLANVTPVLASPGDPRLPRRAVDVVLIVDTFHHIDDRLAYFRRLADALADGGRVAIVDWEKRPLPVGPPPEHKIAREQVVEEMTAAGYALVEQPAFLPYQYFLVFRVAARRRE